MILKTYIHIIPYMVFQESDTYKKVVEKVFLCSNKRQVETRTRDLIWLVIEMSTY